MKSHQTDHVVAYMQKHNLQMTREKYLELAYLGDPPLEWSAELEAELPEQFQQWDDEGADND